MATKFPRKVVFIVFPYGIVDPKRPNIHFSFEDQKLIVDEINAHRKTTYYLKRNRKKHLLTVEGNRVLVNGKDFSQESISINTIAEEKRTIIFGSFPYGYANLANPSRHYTEQEIKDMISFYPQKKYFLHDRNTYLTYNLSKRQLVTINRPLRRFSLWVALVSLCVIVPFFTSVGLLSAAVNTLSYQYKGKRPGSFDSGFSMAL
jgi:hypothetical protein